MQPLSGGTIYPGVSRLLKDCRTGVRLMLYSSVRHETFCVKGLVTHSGKSWRRDEENEG